ncbi:unnamed protein product [Pleuronectes platessa]|uniref:Uncharacterized protein n=1 Tax=Pleuronectes platessa TaxID=8262 RepID=A0A9N7YTN7_PLEPL|nr:unnamed protein product [Pleuronectes platessa]
MSPGVTRRGHKGESKGKGREVREGWSITYCTIAPYCEFIRRRSAFMRLRRYLRTDETAVGGTRAKTESLRSLPMIPLTLWTARRKRIHMSEEPKRVQVNSVTVSPLQPGEGGEGRRGGDLPSQLLNVTFSLSVFVEAAKTEAGSFS